MANDVTIYIFRTPGVMETIGWGLHTSVQDALKDRHYEVWYAALGMVQLFLKRNPAPNPQELEATDLDLLGEEYGY